MSRKTTLPVALVQERNHGDAPANLAIIEARVAEAAKQGAKLVLLQELHNGPYFCQHESVAEFNLAETIPGPSTERLGKLAKQHRIALLRYESEKTPTSVRVVDPPPGPRGEEPRHRARRPAPRPTQPARPPPTTARPAP